MWLLGRWLGGVPWWWWWSEWKRRDVVCVFLLVVFFLDLLLDSRDTRWFSTYVI